MSKPKKKKAPKPKRPSRQKPRIDSKAGPSGKAEVFAAARPPVKPGEDDQSDVGVALAKLLRQMASTQGGKPGEAMAVRDLDPAGVREVEQMMVRECEAGGVLDPAVKRELEHIGQVAGFTDDEEEPDEGQREVLVCVARAAVRQGAMSGHRLVKWVIESDARDKSRVAVECLVRDLRHLWAWVQHSGDPLADGYRAVYAEELGEHLRGLRRGLHWALDQEHCPLRRSVREAVAVALLCRTRPDPSSVDRRILPRETLDAISRAADVLEGELSAYPPRKAEPTNAVDATCGQTAEGQPLDAGSAGEAQTAKPIGAGQTHGGMTPGAESPARERRGGRLRKDDSDAKRVLMLATLRAHPSLRDAPGTLGNMVGVSESTARRWLEDEERKYRESKAANPEPAEE
jgi:hypothetical protein